MGLILVIIIGAIAGWLASKILKKRDKGLIVNAILGILGAMVGRWAFSFIGLHADGSLIGELSTGVIGAIIILFVANKLNIFD